MIRPADPHSPEDLDIVRRLDALGNRAFLGPELDGAYPEDLLADTASVTDWSFVRDGDLEAIHQPIDVLGVNYYTTSVARKWDGVTERNRDDGHKVAAQPPRVVTLGRVASRRRCRPPTSPCRPRRTSARPPSIPPPAGAARIAAPPLCGEGGRRVAYAGKT